MVILIKMIVKSMFHGLDQGRGIDIPQLDNVINWDFPPPKPKLFVHRLGRAGRTGTAFSSSIHLITERDNITEC